MGNSSNDDKDYDNIGGLFGDQCAINPFSPCPVNMSARSNSSIAGSLLNNEAWPDFGSAGDIETQVDGEEMCAALDLEPVEDRNAAHNTSVPHLEHYVDDEDDDADDDDGDGDNDDSSGSDSDSDTDSDDVIFLFSRSCHVSKALPQPPSLLSPGQRQEQNKRGREDDADAQDADENGIGERAAKRHCQRRDSEARWNDACELVHLDHVGYHLRDDSGHRDQAYSWTACWSAWTCWMRRSACWTGPFLCDEDIEFEFDLMDPDFFIAVRSLVDDVGSLVEVSWDTAQNAFVGIDHMNDRSLYISWGLGWNVIRNPEASFHVEVVEE